ncbi:MAG: SLBB domain-containing protein, partial [Microthrixaceae bacterium]
MVDDRTGTPMTGVRAGAAPGDGTADGDIAGEGGTAGEGDAAGDADSSSQGEIASRGESRLQGENSALDALVRRIDRRPTPPSGPFTGRIPAWLGMAILFAALVGGFLAWTTLGREPPIEGRMPNAGDGANQGGERPSEVATTDGTAGGPTAGDPRGGDSTGDARAGSSAVGADRAAGAPGGLLTVHVAGAVVEPGLVTVASDGRVADAANAAGGLSELADLDRINLAAPLSDGARVFIPARGQQVPTEVTPVVPGADGPAEG